MKKLIFGGFLLISGAIMYSVGTLGFADTQVAAYMMQAPQYIGVGTMLAGLAFSVLGLKSDK